MRTTRSNADRKDQEERIDRYVRDYSVRTLAEMLVELEDLYAPHAARKFARRMKNVVSKKKHGRVVSGA
jgi:hypothetical protein